MPKVDTEINVIEGGWNYKPKEYGSHAGKPIVELKLSKSDSNATKIRSLKNQFETYGWSSKIRSGRARFVIGGTEPVHERNEEVVDDLVDILSPRFVDFEVDTLQREPSRGMKRMVDYYSVWVPRDNEFDYNVLDFYSNQSSSYGNSEFIFKVSKNSDEEYIRNISNEFGIYDNDIYLYPKGRKINTVSENLEKCWRIAKRNSWNVSPRIDIPMNFEEE